MCVYTNISLTEYTYICMYIQNAHVCMYMYKVGDYLLVCLHSAIFFLSNGKPIFIFFHVDPSEVKEDISFLCGTFECVFLLRLPFYLLSTTTLWHYEKSLKMRNENIKKSRVHSVYFYIKLVLLLLFYWVTLHVKHHSATARHGMIYGKPI